MSETSSSTPEQAEASPPDPAKEGAPAPETEGAATADSPDGEAAKAPDAEAATAPDGEAAKAPDGEAAKAPDAEAATAPPAAPPKPPGKMRRAWTKLRVWANIAGVWIARQFEGVPPRRSWTLLGTALLPALAILLFDTISRREIFVNRAGPPIGGYIGGAALSLSLWGFTLESARHPRRRVRYPAMLIVGITAFFGLGGQLLFQATSHEYFNRDAVLFSIEMWPIILDYLLQNAAVNLGVLFGSAALAIAYAAIRHRLHGPRQRLATIGWGFAVLACLLNAFIPWRAPASKHGLPPEVLFWHAAGGAGLYATGFIDKPPALPPGKHLQLPPSKAPAVAAAPDIVLIFGESVRRDEVCSQPSESCKKSPELDATAPERIGFRHSFSVASCTEVASAVLWSGLHILSKPEELQTAPLVWDFAKARGYRTGYLTSQNLSFQDQGTFLRTSAIDEKREARDRNPHSDVDIGSPDEVSAAEALAFIEKGGGPAFAVLHFSNTHLPYRQVPGHTPHQKSADKPSGKKPANEAADARHMKYLNSLVHQDAVIGDFLRGLRKTERGKRAIVIYTADHGEAWGEHGSWTHTFDLYGEQINVPLWIDAPAGSLTDAQRNWLRGGADNRPVYTADVTATVLDMLGALDDKDYSANTSRLAGTSLLRPLGAREIMLSNCPPFRGCFPDAWGMVRWPLKFHYVGRETDSVCVDIRKDPAEKSPLPTERCQPMRDALNKHYGVRFDKTWNKYLNAHPSAGSGSGSGSAGGSGSGSASGK